jgi:hypothetical protein
MGSLQTIKTKEHKILQFSHHTNLTKTHLDCMLRSFHLFYVISKLLYSVSDLTINFLSFIFFVIYSLLLIYSFYSLSLKVTPTAT